MTTEQEAKMNEDMTCGRCGETIGRNRNPIEFGGYANFGKVAMSAGHYAILCPDGIHYHTPAEAAV